MQVFRVYDNLPKNHLSASLAYQGQARPLKLHRYKIPCRSTLGNTYLSAINVLFVAENKCRVEYQLSGVGGTRLLLATPHRLQNQNNQQGPKKWLTGSERSIALRLLETFKKGYWKHSKSIDQSSASFHVTQALPNRVKYGETKDFNHRMTSSYYDY